VPAFVATEETTVRLLPRAEPTLILVYLLSAIYLDTPRESISSSHYTIIKDVP